MQKVVPHLDFIINAHNFQKIQDCLSEASQMAMLTVDYQGNPVTEHSRCSAYCTKIRSIEGLNNLCRKCDSRGGLESARLSKPYLYICHMGLLDFAVPIVVEGHYTGAVLSGQVIVKDKLEETKLEKIVDSKNIEVDAELQKELDSLYALLPVMTFERVQIFANMAFHITNYIIEEALAKINLNESWQEKMSVLESPLHAKTQGSQLMQNTQAAPMYNSIILEPALDFIQKNFEKEISIDDMASLCNISSSYFSKLFNKITGDTFSNYINHVRIERACELLLGTDTPITIIALDLGFEDNSYFNKVFKRLTGLTPSAYRSGNKTQKYFF